MAPKSLYKTAYARQAEKLCELGATDLQLGDFFGVSKQTINTWKEKYPAFGAALTEGKAVADNAVVQSLFKRATGYERPAVKLFYDKEQGVVEAPYVERFAPDTTACIFWLKNRRPDEWRDRRDVDVTSKGKTLAELLALGMAAAGDGSDQG